MLTLVMAASLGLKSLTLTWRYTNTKSSSKDLLVPRHRYISIVSKNSIELNRAPRFCVFFHSVNRPVQQGQSQAQSHLYASEGGLAVSYDRLSSNSNELILEYRFQKW